MSCKHCEHCQDKDLQANGFMAGHTYKVLPSGKGRGAAPGLVFVAKKANISFTGEAWQCSINGGWAHAEIAWLEHCKDLGKRGGNK